MENDGVTQCEEFTALAEEMWNNDNNALTSGSDYELDIQGKTRFSKEGIDKADDPLFIYVSPCALEKPTFKAFIALLDNYESETGIVETVTNEERRENWHFINLIFDTSVMKLAHKFLVSKGKASPNIDDFKQDFHDMWFKL